MATETTPILATTGFFTIAAGLLVLLIGYQQAKSRNFKNHKYLMLGATAINGAFLIQYITRFLMREETRFSGPTFVRDFIYLPILVVHITLAVVTIFLVLIHLKRTLSHEQQKESGEPFFQGEYRQDHRSFGLITFRLWAISFVGGIIVFLMLYVLY